MNFPSKSSDCERYNPQLRQLSIVPFSLATKPSTAATAAGTPRGVILRTLRTWGKVLQNSNRTIAIYNVNVNMNI